MEFLLENMKKEKEKLERWKKYYNAYSDEKVKELDLVNPSFTHMTERKIPKKRMTKVPVICVDTGQRFPSMKKASEFVGMNYTTFAMYFKQKKGKIKGYTFIYG